MPNPLIVMGEHHCDPRSRETLKALLVELRGLDYSRLCLEQPSQLNQAQMLKLIDSTIAVIEALVKEAMQRTLFQGTAEDFLQLPYSVLVTLLTTVTPDALKMALTIQSLIPHRILKSACELWVQMGGTLHAYDLDSAHEKAINEVTLENWIANGYKELQHREGYMSAQIKQHYGSNAGTIVLTGLGHLSGLFRCFQTMNMANNCLVVFPHASQWLGDNADQILPKLAVKLPSNTLTAIVDTQTQIAHFIKICKQRLQTLTARFTDASNAPTFTPLANASNSKPPVTTHADDSFSFMKNAFKNGF